MSNTNTTAAAAVTNKTTFGKEDIAAAVAAAHPELKTKKTAAEVVETVLAAISSKLAAGAEVRLHGFGHFKTKAAPARTGRNPRTGEEIQIPASTAVKFSPAKALKDAAA